MSQPTPAQRPHLLAACAFVLALVAENAGAAVVLNTYGPGDTVTGPNWSLFDARPAAIDLQFIAVPFSLSELSTISSIQASIAGVGSFQVGIVPASAGLPSDGAGHPSTVLLNPVGNDLISGLHWDLVAGDYWIVATAAPGTQGTWQGGRLDSTTEWAFQSAATAGTWAKFSSGTPAVRITTADAASVPEPGTLALTLASLALLGAAAAARSRPS